MSWCGGGEMSSTPGVEKRSSAMYSETLRPGSCPPSPGFAPWAILICSISALARYSAVTPKRPEATCLIFDLSESPSRSGMSTSMRPFPSLLCNDSPALTGA
ncbi:hypothetical protein D3C83_58180 [compost metagenome]